jgi:hypothetical protein
MATDFRLSTRGPWNGRTARQQHPPIRVQHTHQRRVRPPLQRRSHSGLVDVPEHGHCAF